MAYPHVYLRFTLAPAYCHQPRVGHHHLLIRSRRQSVAEDLARAEPNPVPPTQTVSFCYDELHRVTGKGYGAQSCPLTTPVVSYVYDSSPNAIGHLTSLTDQAGTASYTYDILGRLATETRTIAGVSKSTSYAYNLDGSVKTLTYPSGRVVTYTPDSAGRLVSAVDGNGTNYVTSASYNPDSSLKSLLNGSTPALNQNFQYTPRLQLCRITALTSGTLPTSCTDTQNIGNIMDRGYDFHAGNGTAGSGTDNGNVFAITNYRDATRSQAFTYDALNRLASGWSSANTGTYSWGENYSIDAWGNLQISPMSGKAHGGNFTLSGNTQNRPTGLAYDAAGNLMSYLSSAYTYDQENRLSSTDGMSYTYDANGERVLKSNTSTGAAMKRYWSMGGNTLAEGDGSGSLTAEYVYFGGKRVARIDLPGNTVHYYLSDHLGSTSIVASAAGAIEEESDYYPFGTEVMVAGPGANELKFTGKRRDAESQLDYFEARYYSKAFGRFMRADEPFADQDAQDAQSWNLYVYAANNPIRYNDPSGASHVDNDGWTVGDFHGELINNGTLYWNANDQVWTNPPLTDDQMIMQGATAIANLTSLESISDLGIHGINDAMLVEGMASLPGALRSGAAFINSFKNGVKMAGVRAAGELGESLVQQASGFAKNTKQITSATGTASFRVPDVLNEANGVIGEVKNTNGKLYLSNQIKDDIAYAQAKGLTFKLFVRGGVTFSGPLQTAISNGAVTVVRF